MASFEPFVGSDPFTMDTFNTKLGNSFNTVDKNIARIDEDIAKIDPEGYYVGRISNFIDAKSLARVGDKFLPCLGQILPANDYPEYAESQGPLLGYKWTDKIYDNVFSFFCYCKTSTGRIVAVGRIKNETGNPVGIFVSDDNCQTFVLKMKVADVPATESNPAPSAAFYTKNDEILLFGYKTRWISTDNGETFTSQTIGVLTSTGSNKFNQNLQQFPSGRLVSFSSSIIVSDNNGLTWTEKATETVTLGNGIITKTGVSMTAYSHNCFQSKDEWETYTKILVANNDTFNNIFEVENVLLTCSNSAIYISTDMGKHWSLWNSSHGAINTSPKIALGQTIYLNGKFSIDLGRSWIDISGSVSSVNRGMCFQTNNGNLIILNSDSQASWYSEVDTTSIILPVADGYVCMK